MNYYERHLGDYAKDTLHLSMLEHGAYTLLMDRYYSTEHGIPADQVYRVALARSKDEKAAVDTILNEFFTLNEGVFTKGRIEEEIVSHQEKRRRIEDLRNRESYRQFRDLVFSRDAYTCQYCGITNVSLQLDHVHPKSRGGADTPDNLVAACKPCNTSKGAKTPEEWMGSK